MTKAVKQAFISFLLLWMTVFPQTAAAKPDMNQGMADLEARRFDQAVKTFSAVIKENPNNYRAYTGRGTARFYLDKFDQAIADYNLALGINPTFADAHLGRGMAWYYSGRYQSAIADYQDALKTDPHNPRILNQLAWTLAVCPLKHLRDGKKALDLAKKATALDSGLHYLDTLAAAYAEAGDFRSAVKTQKQVVSTMIESNHENEIDIYLERLRAYKKNKPWHDRSDRRPSAKEVVKQPVKEAAKEPVKEAAKEPAKEVAKEQMKEAAKEPVKEVAKEPVKEVAKEPVKEVAKEPAKEVAKEPVKEAAKEPVKEVAKEPAKEIAKKSDVKQEPSPADTRAGTASSIEEPPPLTEGEPAVTAAAESAAIAAAGTGASQAAASQAEDKPQEAPVTAGQPSVAPDYESTRPYTIQVSSYRDRQKALTVATDLVKKGDPAFFSQAAIGGTAGETTLWYRVFVGVYDTKMSADEAASKLLKRRFRHPEVKYKPYSVQIGLFNDQTDLEKAIEDLRADGYLSYRVAHGENQTRLLIGAYRTPAVPATLINALKDKGYYPIVVKR